MNRSINQSNESLKSKPKTKRLSLMDRFRLAGKNWQLLIMIMPVIIFFIVFHYVPMYGVQIAFRRFMPVHGIWGSPWVGLDHFTRFFNMHYAGRLIWNTLSLSLYSLAAGFPMPILLALAINEIKDGRFKKFIQTVTYAPNFISVVVIVGMIITFLSPSTGVINHLLDFLGMERQHFMQNPRWFRHIYVLSGIWQTTGWGTVIYLAALSGVDTQLHEAATIDGATRLQRLWYINVPVLVPTMIILLIMNFGGIMAVGFEKVFLMQNSLNMGTSDVIATFTYRTGLLEGQYSYAAAIGLFNSLINSVMLLTVNWIARKYSETSLI
ncbi:ABC transporter permease [Marinilactibacillus sp. XAAS-LB27]|uniref:ABC transporter permease n=1 Tax=Marinilactibacillus sp. XAAS-LB27 TaxID=3114538 RepID=UPI003FA60CEA